MAWCVKKQLGVQRLACVRAGIAAGEADAAVAAGINLMLWHEVTAGICQLQARRRTSNLTARQRPQLSMCCDSISLCSPVPVPPVDPSSTVVH